MIKNGPVFEWIPGNIILDYQEEKEGFYNLINNLQHHHNDEDDSDYVTDNSYEGENRLESWKDEYFAMYNEEFMIVTYDDIAEGGDIRDHEYFSNEREEGKIRGHSEVEEGYNDCDDEEGSAVEEEEEQSQEDPQKKPNNLRRNQQVDQ